MTIAGRVRERAGTRVIVSLWQDTPPSPPGQGREGVFGVPVCGEFFLFDISGYRSVLHMAITVSEILSLCLSVSVSPVLLLSRYHSFAMILGS